MERHRFSASGCFRGRVILVCGSGEASVGEIYRQTLHAQQWDRHWGMLTGYPLDDGSAHINLFVKGIYQFEKRFDSLVCATSCIQGLTKTLLNRDAEIVKFPSRYLTNSATDFDIMDITVKMLTSETTKSSRLVPEWCRSWARARLNNCIAPSLSLFSMRKFPRRRYIYAYWKCQREYLLDGCVRA